MRHAAASVRAPAPGWEMAGTSLHFLLDLDAVGGPTLHVVNTGRDPQPHGNPMLVARVAPEDARGRAFYPAATVYEGPALQP